jgi:serine/threonine protein kinase
MSGPATVQAFLALVLQSGLIDEESLSSYRQRRRTKIGTATEPRAAADLLIHDGLLTHFQAEQLLKGRYKRFTIGRYKVLDQLGSGGMGLVYLCEHRHMRRRVALKVLPVAKTRDPACLERFYREARAAAALNHPNIVRAYDIGQEDDLHFLVMEYVDGSNLREIVSRKGTLTPLQAFVFLRQAASGLQHVYQAGLVHRDIKPDNLLVDMTGTLKILDLGLARFFLDENDNLTIRKKEMVLGTIDFVAPEQAINSHDVYIRADIYSLGATFYYALTSSPPLGNGSLGQKLLWLHTHQPPAIREVRPDVPKDLAAIIEKAMSKDRDNRYQTPAEMIKDLESVELLAGETANTTGDVTFTTPDQWSKDYRREVIRWLLVAGGVTLVVGTLLFVLAAWLG